MPKIKNIRNHQILPKVTGSAKRHRKSSKMLKITKNAEKYQKCPKSPKMQKITKNVKKPDEAKGFSTFAISNV